MLMPMAHEKSHTLYIYLRSLFKKLIHVRLECRLALNFEKLSLFFGPSLNYTNDDADDDDLINNEVNFWEIR